MSDAAQSILDQALRLSTHERAEIARALLDSVQAKDTDDVETAWETEIQRRLRDEKGSARPWEDVRRELNERFGLK